KAISEVWLPSTATRIFRYMFMLLIFAKRCWVNPPVNHIPSRGRGAMARGFALMTQSIFLGKYLDSE
ncbi:MAG: hypothetical protein ACYCZ4_14920, partial [Sulfuricella sp.]